MKKSLEQGDVAAFEITALKKDGHDRSFEYNQILVYEDEEPVAIRILTRDVTEEFKAKKALEISESRYRSVFENTGLPTLILEQDLTASRVNVRFEALTGISKADIEGKMDLARFIVPDEHFNKLESLLKRPDTPCFELECQLTGRHGQVFDMII